MSELPSYGGYFKLITASELYPYRFEVYGDGNLDKILSD